MKYFDAHIHLTDDHFSDYTGHILSSLRSLNIKACSVTVDLTTSKKSLILFNNQQDVILNSLEFILNLRLKRI